jgi:hypothetical protein
VLCERFRDLCVTLMVLVVAPLAFGALLIAFMVHQTNVFDAMDAIVAALPTRASQVRRRPGSGASAHNRPDAVRIRDRRTAARGCLLAMNRAVLKINEILDRNPALAQNLPVTPPRILDVG